MYTFEVITTKFTVLFYLVSKKWFLNKVYKDLLLHCLLGILYCKTMSCQDFEGSAILYYLQANKLACCRFILIPEIVRKERCTNPYFELSFFF